MSHNHSEHPFLPPDEDVVAASADLDQDTISAFSDRFDELVSNPIGDIVNWLEPSALLQLLQPAKRGQWTQFLQDLRTPARSLSLVVAERALSTLRRKSPAQQEKYLSWLVVPIARNTTSLTSEALPQATRQYGELQLGCRAIASFDDAIAEWGPAATALAMCLRWKHPGRPARLAYLLADGRAVPPTWSVDDTDLVTARDTLIGDLDAVISVMLEAIDTDASFEDEAGLFDDHDHSGDDHGALYDTADDDLTADEVPARIVATATATATATAAGNALHDDDNETSTALDAPAAGIPTGHMPPVGMQAELDAAGLRLTLGAVDPVAARTIGAARRVQANQTGSAGLEAEADLWDALAKVGELGHAIADLAPLAATADRPTRPTFHGIIEHETDAWAAAIASPDGESLIEALRNVIESHGGSDGSFVRAVAALSTHPAAGTLPATITAAMNGTVTLTANHNGDPVMAVIMKFLGVGNDTATPPPTSADITGDGIDTTDPAPDAPTTDRTDVTDDGPAVPPAPAAADDRNQQPVLPADADDVAEDEPELDPAALADAHHEDDLVEGADGGEPGGSDATGPVQDSSASSSSPEASATAAPPEDRVTATPAAAPTRPPVVTATPAPVSAAEPTMGEHDSADPGTSDDSAAVLLAINGDEDTIEQARRALISAGAWSVTAELDRRCGNHTATWHAASIAEHLRSPYSPLVAEFTAFAAGLDPRTVRDASAQIVGIAASVRVAYIAPTAGAGFAATALASVRSDRPGITAIAAAAQRADEMSLSYATESVGVTAGAAAWDASMSALSNEANEILHRNGRTTFERGSWIWESWVSAGGELDELLRPVADRDPSAVNDVRRIHRNLSSDKGIRELITSGDAKHRPSSNRSRIDGNARRTLQRWIAEAVTLAGRWLVTADANPARTTPEGDRRAEQLRGAFNDAWPQARKELQALADGDDRDLAAASTAALVLLQPIVDLVCNGEPLTGSEPAVEVALRGGLLRTSCGLNQDLTVSEAEVHVSALEAAASTTWNEAFEHRIGANQFNLATIIADEVSRLGEPSGPALVERARIEGDVAVARMHDTVASLETRLSEAQRFGRITADAAEILNAQLEGARRPRRDLDHVVAEISDVADALVVEAAAAKARLAEFIAQHAHNDAYAVVEERIERILDSDLPDLATAEDLLQRALDGEDVATRTTEARQTFGPAVMRAMAGGINSETVTACAERATSPLDFSGLDETTAKAGAGALEAWHKAATGPRQQDWRDALSPVFLLLGLRGGTENRRRPSDADHHRFDLSNVVPQGKALVPEFGSSTHGLYAFVLVWNRPSIDTLLTWIGQDAREAQATIVFYFGTLTPEQRCQLTNKLRKGSQRPVVVVDAAVLAHLARVGTATFEDLMRATLPYAAVNPFFIGGGDVPVEMFYGRMDERRDVMENRDRTLIFGGRRLGKSALLRSAKKRFEEGGPNRKAVLVDLYIAGIGQHRRPAAVWDELLPALIAAGLAPLDRKRREDPDKAAPRIIREWLEADNDRRLLVLLDEADDFFDADAQFGFTQTAQFRDLKDTFKGRFKVVFAGLHQVARFKHHHNQPFAQFVVDEAPIGPLPAGPANDLLTRPLDALGWYFASPDLPARALHACNYIPILIQELGRSLVKLLSTRELSAGEARTAITAADLDEVLRLNQSRAKERIDVTLELDHRYKVIAWGVALGEVFSIEGPTTTDALYDSCRSWWPDGFARTNFTEFRSLVDELVHLGILAARTDPATGTKSWALRSRNMQNLLGTTDEIQTNLDHLVRDNPPVGSFFGASTRRMIDQEGAASALSPLTEGQLTDVVGIGQSQIRFVVGTTATGVHRVRDAIASVNRSLQDRCQVIQVVDLKGLKRALIGDTERHQVVIDDLVAKGVGTASLRQTVQLVLDKAPPVKGTRSVVMIIDPAQYIGIADMLSRSSTTAGVDVNVVACERFDSDGLRAYMLADQGFASSNDREVVMKETGGWPSLVDAVVAEYPTTTLRAALDKLESLLATADGCEEFIDAAGLDDATLRSAFDVVISLVDGPGAAASVEALAEFVPDPASIDALRLAGALAETADGNLYPETILARRFVTVVNSTND